MQKYYCVKDNGIYKEGGIYTINLSPYEAKFFVTTGSLRGKYFCIIDHDNFKAGRVYDECMNGNFIYISSIGNIIPSQKLLCVKDIVNSAGHYLSEIKNGTFVEIQLFSDFSFGEKDSDGSFIDFEKYYNNFISLAEYRNKQIDEILN